MSISYNIIQSVKKEFKVEFRRFFLSYYIFSHKSMQLFVVLINIVLERESTINTSFKLQVLETKLYR